VKKIERKQTRDHITQMIRYEILSGGMKPGEELAQESIAEQLGLSRMPVREALQALEQEGFLVRLPNRHMQVAKLEPDHVRPRSFFYWCPRRQANRSLRARARWRIRVSGRGSWRSTRR